VLDFVESIGERVILVGWSAGPCGPSRRRPAAPRRPPPLYEPTIIPLMAGDDSVRRDSAYRQMTEAAVDDRPADTARAFHRFVGTDHEVGALGGFYADTVRHVAEHIADPHVRTPLHGVGHWAPQLGPQPLAAELQAFVETA
jgi:hypothetical protein